MPEGFDDSDKIRRNLVVFSTAIIVGASLGVKVEGGAKLLGFAELAKPEPWKVWSVMACLLLYQIARYRFDDATDKLLEKAQEQYRKAVVPQIGRYLGRRLLRDIQRSGTSSLLESTALMDSIQSLEAKDVPGVESSGAPWQLAQLRMTGKHEGAVWRGRHNFQVVLTVDGEGSQGNSRSTSAFADYTTPRFIKPPIVLYALARVAFYSKTGIDLLFPYLLGFTALLVCLWKIFAPLLNGWV